MIANIKKFSNEVQGEMKKVSWPTVEQLKESTYVVITVTLVISAIVAVMDFGISNIVGMMFDNG